VCYDAGKEKSIYTSHFVKSSPINGEVVCPTLKMLECRYCGNKGHTVKFCKVLSERNNLKKEEKEEKELLCNDVSVIDKVNTDSVVDVSKLKGWSAIVGIEKHVIEEKKEEEKEPLLKISIEKEKESLKTNIDLSVGSDYSREIKNLPKEERFWKKEYIPKRNYNNNMYKNSIGERNMGVLWSGQVLENVSKSKENKKENKKEKNIINKNMFDGLCDLCDSDDENNNEEINNPIPVPPIIKSIIRRNWADEEIDSSDGDDAADKDIAMKIEKERLNGWVSLETNSNNLNLTDKNINMNKPKVEEYKFTYRPRLEGKRIIKNWADEETDDSSDDDEAEIEEMSAW